MAGSRSGSGSSASSASHRRTCASVFKGAGSVSRSRQRSRRAVICARARPSLKASGWSSAGSSEDVPLMTATSAASTAAAVASGAASRLSDQGAARPANSACSDHGPCRGARYTSRSSSSVTGRTAPVAGAQVRRGSRRMQDIGFGIVLIGVRDNVTQPGVRSCRTVDFPAASGW